MIELSKDRAIEELARGVEKANPNAIAEFYDELFLEKPSDTSVSAISLAKHIRKGLLPEEIVDLWNVVFPLSRNVSYDETEDKLYYDEKTSYYAETE